MAIDFGDTKPDDFVHPVSDDQYPGMTKREAFAMAAMQGLIASDTSGPRVKPRAVAEQSIWYADALIEALNAPRT